MYNMGKKELEETTYLEIFSGSDFLKTFKKIDSKTKLYYQKTFFDSMASKKLCTFYLLHILPSMASFTYIAIFSDTEIENLEPYF